ncbi:MAG: hypothetical protein DDT31_01813 [Syntrophomonadaceae bacterium]|nr:hypothetical protein [Bacillota bacterium]
MHRIYPLEMRKNHKISPTRLKQKPERDKRMIQQTIFSFKLKLTKEALTARSGLSLFAAIQSRNRLKGIGGQVFTCAWQQQRVCALKGKLYETEKYFHHAVATNWDEGQKSAIEALKWHNQRGQAENFNKELKNGFGMERMPCGQTEANAVFFRIGVIAYNLFIGFKRLACPEAWIKRTIATFRWKMIQVAGRIVKHSGSVFLKIAAGLEKLELYLGIRRKIYELM